MKGKYTAPEIGIVYLECEDVIVTSNELPFEPVSEGQF